MSAPFTVAYGYGDGHKKFPTLPEAIAFAKSRRNDISVAIYGDDYDADCDAEGYFTCNDGLTDEERETLEEEGLI